MTDSVHVHPAQAGASSTSRIQQATQLASQLESAFFHGISKVRIENGTFVQRNNITISESTFDSVKNSSVTYGHLANPGNDVPHPDATVSLVIFNLPYNLWLSDHQFISNVEASA